MSNCGPKVPKRIELSQMVCVEKLERFQFAVHATDGRTRKIGMLGELSDGKRPVGKSCKRFKYCVKDSLKKVGIDP